jgi:hypothetical protein
MVSNILVSQSIYKTMIMDLLLLMSNSIIQSHNFGTWHFKGLYHLEWTFQAKTNCENILGCNIDSGKVHLAIYIYDFQDLSSIKLF